MPSLNWASPYDYGLYLGLMQAHPDNNIRPKAGEV